MAEEEDERIGFRSWASLLRVVVEERAREDAREGRGRELQVGTVVRAERDAREIEDHVVLAARLDRELRATGEVVHGPGEGLELLALRRNGIEPRERTRVGLDRTHRTRLRVRSLRDRQPEGAARLEVRELCAFGIVAARVRA